MPNLLLDLGGKPVPQYLNAGGTAFEELRGVSGAMNVNLKTSDVGLTALSNLIKHVGSCNAGSNTTIWDPAAGNKIILQGLRIQNLTSATGSYAAGFGSADANVTVLRGATTIATLKLEGRHIINDTTNHLHVMAGGFDCREFDFGSGLELTDDEILYVLSDVATVTVTAWGYEV